VRDELTERYGDLLAGSYDCVDRIVLNAYFSPSLAPASKFFRSPGVKSDVVPVRSLESRTAAPTAEGGDLDTGGGATLAGCQLCLGTGLW
jgi:hypothetical protein